MEFLFVLLSVLVVFIFIAIQLFCLIFLFKNKILKEPDIEEYPFVSVLLAARNEENTILRCLQAFSEIDYPKNRIEFLIGNDDSEDKTRQIALEFINSKPEFKLIDIKKNIGKAAGKANVLAHLVNIAKGEFYFITDCDVGVHSQWVKSILKYFLSNVGIVSGTTTCKPGTFAQNLQTFDWLHFMGYIKSFANAGISCTSVGNNMAVRALAYKQTGGYENIDFSITEDYKLFSEVTSRGWAWRNILEPESLGLATYISSLKELLHQRKRWLIGASDLPLNWKILISIYGMFLPAIIFLFIKKPEIACVLWGLKFLLQSVFIKSLIKKSGLQFNKSILFYFVYEIYLILITIITVFFYFLPIKSVWKGRKYGRSGVG